MPYHFHTETLYLKKGKSYFNNCWFINMYYWNTLHTDQNIRVDLMHQRVLLKTVYSLGNHYKTGPRGENPFVESPPKIKDCAKCLYIRYPLSHLLFIVVYITSILVAGQYSLINFVIAHMLECFRTHLSLPVIK